MKDFRLNMNFSLLYILAREFFEKFCKYQEKYYTEDLQKLSTVAKKEHMKENNLMESFK